MPNPYVLLGALVGAILLCVTSFGLGHHYATLQEDKAIAAAEAHAALVTQQQDQITHDADVAAAQAQVKIQTVVQTQIQKVPVYVTQKASAACAIPAGFVRLHNDSARGVRSVPLAAGDADAATAVSLTDVAGTLAVNYGTYQAVAQQLRDLQAWVTAQQTLKR